LEIKNFFSGPQNGLVSDFEEPIFPLRIHEVSQGGKRVEPTSVLFVSR
jgi:hypothetical protein